MAYRETEHTRAAAEGRHAAVLAAAVEQVAEHGFAQAGAREIAARAAVSVGSIYSYFDNRDALLAAVFTSVAERELVAVRQAVDAAEPRVAERMRALVATFTARALRGPTLATALLFEPVNPLVEAERLAFRRKYHALLEDALRDGIAAGEIPHQDTGVAARGIIGAIGEVVVGQLAAPSGSAAHGTSPEALSTFVLRSIGASL